MGRIMYLTDYLGPWPPQQEIVIYKQDPRIPMYEGTIGKLRYCDAKHWVVHMVQFSMNQILIRVSRG